MMWWYNIIPVARASDVEKLAGGIYASINDRMILVNICTSLTLIIVILVAAIWGIFKKKHTDDSETLKQLVDTVTRIDERLKTLDADIEEKAELVVHRELKSRGVGKR